MPRTRRVGIDGRRTVVWEAADPEGDPLVARVLLRADGEKEFLPFADEITRSFFVFEEGQLSDGGYTFRIEVTDSPGNTAGRTGRDTAETPRFVVDRIPPTVEDLVWQARQGRWEFTFEVEDGLGPPRDVQVAVDGEPFVGALPGVITRAGPALHPRRPNSSSRPPCQGRGGRGVVATKCKYVYYYRRPVKRWVHGSCRRGIVFVGFYINTPCCGRNGSGMSFSPSCWRMRCPER